MAHFPAACLLAEPAPFESYVFDGDDLESDLNDQQQRTISFGVPAGGGMFDGLLLHLVVELDATTTLDTFEQHTSWECSYMRLLPTPLWLPEGSRLELRCHVEAATEAPAYRVDVYADVARAPGAVAPAERLAHVVSFSWSGDG